MILFPAIDLKSGSVVRLAQGQYDKVTEYSLDPVTMAQHWEKKGAQWLHVVDLDGALEGQLKNLHVVLKIVKSIKIPVQTGGGIRTREDIIKLIDGGVARIVLGTKVLEDKTFLKNVLASWKDKIAVSLDCKDGYVAQRGWTETSKIKAVDLVKELENLGVRCIIYTDIARDGMLTGPNIDALKKLLKATKIPVIASGGISSLKDLKDLKALEADGVMGAITGKAIYENKFDLKEALALCSKKE